MGAGESAAAAGWELLGAVTASREQRETWTEKDWRKTLSPLIAARDAKAIAASFAAAFNAAVEPTFFDAFDAFTDHIDPDIFARFVVGLMFEGKDTFDQVLADPRELARRGISRTLHHGTEGFLPVLTKLLRSASVELALALEKIGKLAREELVRVGQVELEGNGPYPERIEEMESEEAHLAWMQSIAYRRELKKRWPELVEDPV